MAMPSRSIRVLRAYRPMLAEAALGVTEWLPRVREKFRDHDPGPAERPRLRALSGTGPRLAIRHPPMSRAAANHGSGGHAVATASRPRPRFPVLAPVMLACLVAVAGLAFLDANRESSNA